MDITTKKVKAKIKKIKLSNLFGGTAKSKANGVYGMYHIIKNGKVIDTVERSNFKFDNQWVVKYKNKLYLIE